MSKSKVFKCKLHKLSTKVSSSHDPGCDLCGYRHLKLIGFVPFQVSWLTDEETVKNCTTGNIVSWKTSNIGATEPFSKIKFNSVTIESFKNKKKSFQKIFDGRAWGGKKIGKVLFHLPKFLIAIRVLPTEVTALQII